MSLARRLGPGQKIIDTPRRLGVIAESVEPSVIPDAASMQKGFEEGLAAGREAAAAERARLLTALEEEAARQLRQATDALESERSAYRDACARLAREIGDDRMWAESLAVEIAYSALARWSGERIGDATWIAACCEALLRELPRTHYSVRVPSGDADLLRENLAGIDVTVDDTLTVGEIVIETPRGDYVSGVVQRMDAVRDALVAGLRRTSER